MAKKSVKKNPNLPKKQQANGKKTSRRRRPRASQGVARSLLSGSVPRAHMVFEAKNQSSLVIRGVEIIAEVGGTAAPFTRSWNVNPTLSDLFPRLSTLSLAFQRWRIRSLRMCYHTAAPATQSGEISLIVLTDPREDVPDNAGRLGNYDYSVVGSISESLCTPMWVNSDPEMLYLSSGRTANGVEQSLKTMGAKVGFLTAHARAVDDGAFAGYISIEYVIELVTPQPAAQRVLSTLGDPFTSSSNSDFKLDRAMCSFREPSADPGLSQSVGEFKVDYMPGVLGTAGYNEWTDDGKSNVADFNAVNEVFMDIDPGSYDWRVKFDLGPEVKISDLPPGLSEYNYARALPMVRGRSEAKHSLPPDMVRYPVYYNPDLVKDPESWCIPLDPLQCSGKKLAVEQHIRDVATSLGPLAPAAVEGDFSVSIWVWNVTTKILSIIASSILPVGIPAAFTSWSGDMALPGENQYVLLATGQPTLRPHRRQVNGTRLILAKRDSV